MSWICVFCETENCDNTCICEVCCKSKGDFYEPLIENHITCKEIAIKGRKCELKKKFQDIGFTKTNYFNADLVGKFAGFNQVFLYMNYDSKYDSVTSVDFRIYEDQIPKPLETYEEIKEVLTKKYGFPEMTEVGNLNKVDIRASLCNNLASRLCCYNILQGQIKLSLQASKKHLWIQITYADDISYYIKKQMQQEIVKKEKRLMALNNDL